MADSSTDSSNDTDTGHDDARLIADSAERLFARLADKAQRQAVEAGEWPAAAWAAVAEGGFPLLLASEASGGFGAPWAVAYPLLRGIGHWQVPLPLAETLVAAQLLSAAGLAVPEGPLTVVQQGRCGPGAGLVAEPAGGRDALRLSGQCHAVPWARHAAAAAVALSDGRVALLPLRGAEGVQITPHGNPAGLPSDTVTLRAVHCTAVGGLPAGDSGGFIGAIAEPAWTLMALARSAMLVGALESALAQAVQYAGERVQFGKPLGKNQAIQQQLALMAGDVAAARMAAQVAVADAPWAGAVDAATGSEVAQRAKACRFSTAVAKVRAGEAATRAAGIAHQVHGAIGFTHEHALHFATRRLWAWREEFGGDAEWAAVLGRAAIAARSAGFWPGLTSRSLA